MAKTAFIWAAVLGVALLFSSCKPAQPTSVSGTIETDETHIASRYGGRVQTISAKEGDSLKPGQVIVELEPGELPAKRDRAAAQLAEMEAGPRKEEIQEARQSWEALEADLAQANSDAKRAEVLFSQKTISPTEHEQATTRARALAMNAAAAKSRYDLLMAGTRSERVAQSRAQLAEIDSQLKEMRIASPADSVLEVLNVKVGDVVAPNQQVATLLLPQHLWVRVYVPEPWLGLIRLGDQVKVRVDSDPSKTFSGNVEQIAREAEFTPRNVQTIGERIKQVFGIKILLGDSQGQLRAGMAADVEFPNAPKP